MSVPARATAWGQIRDALLAKVPAIYELEPGGALGMPLLDADGWMLELTPAGELLCQTGMDIDDLKALLSEGTCEDLGSDEIGKQAKGLMNQTAAKFRPTLREAGFEERTEMNDQYVAIVFARTVPLDDVTAILDRVAWCRSVFSA
ncbi:MAG: hypothetical protein U0172_05165 [Nitrospiraceae bacterium]